MVPCVIEPWLPVVVHAYTCVCFVCVCMLVSSSVQVCVGQNLPSGFHSSAVSPPYVFETGSLPDAEACCLGWSGCPVSPHDLPVSAPPMLRLQAHSTVPDLFWQSTLSPAFCLCGKHLDHRAISQAPNLLYFSLISETLLFPFDCFMHLESWLHIVR